MTLRFRRRVGVAVLLILSWPIAIGCARVRTDNGEPGTGGTRTDLCTTDAECDAAAPICDPDGSCRGCVGANECIAKDSAVPICTGGRCVQCFDNQDCQMEEARICDPSTRLCRGCEFHRECRSEVCDLDTGACVSEAEVVYASASAIGSSSDCSRASPCFFLPDAVASVGVGKPYLRLLPGQYMQHLSITDRDAIIVGEGATLNLRSSPDPEAGVTVTGFHEVVIDSLRVTNVPQGNGLSCTNAQVTVRRGRFERSLGDGINCQGVTVIDSNASDNEGVGIASFDTMMVVERSIITRNAGGGIVGAGLIRNNLILDNGALSGDIGAVCAEGDGTIIAYNTIVSNRVNENFGIVQCLPDTVVSSNIVFGNTVADAQTASQTLTGCVGTRHNLSEVDLSATGTNNLVGDPQFVNPLTGDYSLGRESPAIDAGEPETAPEVDFFSNPRPRGSLPDIGAIESY